MLRTKISITVQDDLLSFIDNYGEMHEDLNRSRAIEIAIKKLRDEELALAYREANKEIDHDWEVTVSDGLKEEDWSDLMEKPKSKSGKIRKLKSRMS